MTKLTRNILFLATTLLLAACGSSKHIAKDKVGTTDGTVLQQDSKAVLGKVFGNSVQQQNIVAKIDFVISAGGKNVETSGSLHMKRNDVIRIQLIDPILGIMEVGRLEFTKEYVLIQDRIHKQYCQEDYSKVKFLQENGLDFYALQALLWNQLYIPGQQEVTEESLKEFSVKDGEDQTSDLITLSRSNFLYKWTAGKENSLIENVNVDYKSKAHGSTNVNCKYSKFVAVGNKKFPSNIQLSLQTTAIKSAKTMTMGFQLGKISNSDKWETRTVPSSKYTRLSAEELLNNLMSLK